MCQDNQVSTSATRVTQAVGDAESTPPRPTTSCCAPLKRALDDAQAQALAPMFKALGDPIRLRLVSLIAAGDAADEGEGDGDGVCVCDLVGCFAVSAPTISHHLKVLREAGLVDSRRRGTWVYYRITPTARRTLAALLP